MASTSNAGKSNAERLSDSHDLEVPGVGHQAQRRRQWHSTAKEQKEKHVVLEAPESDMRSAASSIYMGSYGHRSRFSIGGSLKSPRGSIPGTPRQSLSRHASHNSLQDLLQNFNVDLDSFGVEELRDGFFDAMFFKPAKIDHEDLLKEAERTLPAAFRQKNPLSPRHFLPKQWHELKGVLKLVATTRAGIKLAKSFLAFFIAYVLCLVPTIRDWLEYHSYIMAVSAIISHPGRTVGAQLESAIFTSLGTASGLGWGAFALWLSGSTSVARRGYGGILATLLAIFMGSIAALRSYYIRVYQFVLCAGIAICYTVLSQASDTVSWGKLWDYGKPWLLGQAISLTICFVVFPDAGARPLAVALHDAFGVMEETLILPRPDPMKSHRQLAWTFVNLSQAYRDLVIDFSLTRFKPPDVMILRNLMQAVLRTFLSIKLESNLFEDYEDVEQSGQEDSDQDDETNATKPTRGRGEVVIDIDSPSRRPLVARSDSEKAAVKLVTSKLAGPTSNLLSHIRSSLKRCDAVLMDMSGYRIYLGPPKNISSDIVGALTTIRKAMIRYDNEEISLMNSPALPPSYANHPEVVELFLFVQPIRQAATAVASLLVKIMEMQQKHRGWRIYAPSYPFSKALLRTNAQVRHDRGGVTAGFYFRSQDQLASTMKGMANIYKPHPRGTDDNATQSTSQNATERVESRGKYEEEEDFAMDSTSEATKTKRLRYRAWLVLHRLQGFEMRFALKVIIVTSLLAVPAWVDQSRGWWNKYDSFWAVIFAWIQMHPRIGGNFQDLITRSSFGVLGAIWGGLAYGAGEGNPYVMAIFAAIYMIPLIYRYTQSSHPRSGIVGCISFVVVSLTAYNSHGQPSIVKIAWTRGLAMVIGVIAAVIVNWVLWPFVCRHALRKSLASMMIYSSIIYRGVIAKYVYYDKGEEPEPKDIERSEMLEGRIREGFVRLRQLLALTRHEIRLREPFDPLPYSGLIDGCERFFEYLVSVRQSSLFFRRDGFYSDKPTEQLLSYRRDALAAILMNLYVLAGALRGGVKVPSYLPNAAAARKRLLDQMSIVQAEEAKEKLEKKGTRDSNNEATADRHNWAQIYSYSYSQSLTGCVKQLEQLIKYTKEIVGEQGFNPIDFEGDSDSDDDD